MKSELIGPGRILDMLARGVVTAQIMNLQEQRKRAFELQEQKGIFSEQNVRRALSTLPLVVDLRKTVKNSREDRKGVDIVVVLDPTKSLVRDVRVQVKSSTKMIEKFKADLERKRVPQGKDVEEWLVRNRWIVLNGQLLPNNIIYGFNFQLDRINAYEATHGKVVASGK